MYVRRRNDRGEVTPYKRILFATCGGIRRNNVAFNTNRVNKNATFGSKSLQRRNRGSMGTIFYVTTKSLNENRIHIIAATNASRIRRVYGNKIPRFVRTIGFRRNYRIT